MEYSSKTKQTLLTSLVLVIVVSVAYIMLFLNIKEKNNNISVLQNEVDSTLQREIKLRSVKNLINDTQKEREKLNLYFIADDKIVNFIEDIEEVGAYSGVSVKVTSVSIDESTSGNLNKDKISELLNLDFNIEGRFDELFYFLSMIEKLPFKIDIHRVNFEKVSNNIRAQNRSTEPWKGFLSIKAVKLK
ncbi:MAG: type 4a pilus biogenesis protein PilO [Candidatus Pacebacteria bacterium]|jgi:Tfp pilus assembly protein PilO|nr:type 4a pilus biogenesis protein PilO [Candidatus Paceibacterota bacterium]|tara:strand:- start:31019 stop:31585 length:567 start_codon:yes stop_codon:yes gene_type:complete